MKEKIQNLFDELAPYGTALISLFGVINVLLVVFEFIFKINLGLPLILVGGITIGLIYAFKDIVENKDKKEKMFHLMILFSFWGTVIGFLSGMVYSLSTSLILTRLMLIPIFFIPIVAFIATRSQDKKKAIEAILNINIWKKNIKEEYREGSVTLGTNSETNKKVIQPYDDRFVHMLILGATGTGKTSQILTPMILQDISTPGIGVIVLEPKGDLAEQVWALGEMNNRVTKYFDPEYKLCPYFNPLMGDEDDVTENLVTTFKILNPDSSTFFQDQAEQLLRQACKVLKRLYKDEATFIDMNILLTNPNNEGVNMVKRFMQLPTNSYGEADENKRVATWFLYDYYTGASGERNATKTFEHCSSVRAQILKLISNRYLKNVLNPPKKTDPDYYLIEERGLIDFDQILADGDVLAMSSCQGKLRDLGKFLGFFLILQLQSAVFRRPGNVDTRRGCMLYIDEFQTYANPGFSDMLTQGRSYRVASHLATQNRALIGMNSGSKGKSFIDLVSTNARSVVIFPGASYEDARFYSLEFGVDIVEKVNKSNSRKIGWFADPSPSESVSVKEEKVDRFSPTDITYREFGEVIVRLIKNKSIQRPEVVKIQFIPKEAKRKIDEYLQEYYKNKMSDTEEEISLVQDAPKGIFEIIDDEETDDSIELQKKPKEDTITLYDVEESSDVSYVDDILDDIEVDDLM